VERAGNNGCVLDLIDDVEEGFSVGRLCCACDAYFLACVFDPIDLT
jgi:hypothetical protein